MKPILSVVLPVGPSRDGSTALGSLQKKFQGTQHEIIVVRDGPSSKPPLGALDARVTSVTLTKHGGASAARNEGAKFAAGEVLCFLDDDDAYLAGTVPYIAKLMSSARGPDVVALRARLRSGRRVPMGWRSRLSTKDLQYRNVAGGCSCMVVRRSLFEVVGGFDITFPSMQDWDLWLRLLEYTAAVRSGSLAVLYDDISTDRISTNPFRRRDGLISLLAKHGADWPPAVRDFHQVRIAIADWRAENRHGDHAAKMPLTRIFRPSWPLGSAAVWAFTRLLSDRVE